MRLLLDTHVWLWALVEPERLRPGVRRRLGERDTERWLSPLSVWELGQLIDRGRVVVDGSDWLPTVLREVPMRDAPLTREVALATSAVTVASGDPVDQLLAATARVHDLVLVTADRALLAGSGYQVLNARR